MPSILKATTFSKTFRKLLVSPLRSHQGWQQPQLVSCTNVLRTLAHYCSPVSYKLDDGLLGKASPLTGTLLPGHHPRETCWEFEKGDAMAVGMVCGVGREPAICKPNTPGVVSKNRVETVLLSAISSRSLHKSASVIPDKAIHVQLLETGKPDAAHQGPSQKSHSSSCRPSGRKGHGPLRHPCEHPGCKVKRSNYGFPNSNRTRCHRHQLPGMVIGTGGCKVDGCNTVAMLGFPEGKKTRCQAHKLKGMVNKCCPVCVEPGCTRQAKYGRKDETSPSTCAGHAKEDMIAIYPLPSQRCCAPGCMSQGAYGLLSDKSRKFCIKHRSGGMDDLLQTRCEGEGCKKIAKFGWPSMGVWLRCSDHREEGMVRNERCQTEGCVKAPSFGNPEDKVPSRCKEHMEDGMRDLRRKALCDAWGCERKAYYGLQGERPSRCREHKEGEMVHVTVKLCEVSGCREVACFGIEGQARTRCLGHKEEGMVRAKKG